MVRGGRISSYAGNGIIKLPIVSYLHDCARVCRIVVSRSTYFTRKKHTRRVYALDTHKIQTRGELCWERATLVAVVRRRPKLI